MRRLQLTAFGAPTEVLTLNEAPSPQLTSEQLLVRMEAAPLNGSDFMLIQGMYPVRPALPFNVGTEGVGRVVEAGSAAKRLEGRRVVILPTYEQGTWADETVVDQKNVVVVDDSADPLQLAMLAINPATAYLLLKQFKHLMPGDWLGQTAANSAMGQYIIQLSKLSGIKTLNVVRRLEAAQAVREFGGDAVVVQGETLRHDIETALGEKRLTLVLDTLGGEPIGTLMHFLKVGGAGVGYALQTGVPPQVSPIDLYFGGLSLHGFWMINWIRNAPREEVQEVYGHLSTLIAEGKLYAEVQQTYPLDQFKDAVAHAQKSERNGKILFRFS